MSEFCILFIIIIGNCYTRASKTMRTINMPPKRRVPPQLYGPLGPNGETQFPPLKPWAEREKERLEALKKEKDKHKLQKGMYMYISKKLFVKLRFNIQERNNIIDVVLGLVLLEDLVSGAYEKRKAAEAEAKKRRIEKKRKEKAEAELAAQEALKKYRK